MNNGQLPTKIDNYQTFNGGISPYEKAAAPNQYAHGRSIDVRSNPKEVTLLPRTTKESGSVYQDLPVAADRVGNTTYLYDQSGNIYTRSSAGSHALARSVANSHGNGLLYFGEDDFLYYTSDKVIGRYGQLGGTPAFVDDFLGSEGGVPLNTYWIDFEASSSQYAIRNDTASLSITGDITIEATIRPESLPTVGNSMTLAAKWDENGDIRSYKFDIYAISGYFGDGSDGSLTISSNTTEAPIDSACTGTSGAYSLSATNASFAANQIILIHQTQGTGAGTKQRNKIISYTAGTISLETALNANYVSGAQVRVLKQYTNVTINNGVTYTAKSWDGTVGGILAFIGNGTLTVTGSIRANGSSGVFQSPNSGNADTTGGGFYGGRGGGNVPYSGWGSNANGAADTFNTGGSGGGGHQDNAGRGGGNGANATSSGSNIGGIATGDSSLTSMTMGGGGGGGSYGSNSGSGGSGAGIIFAAVATIVISGGINADGGAGGSGGIGRGGGGGAGGSILLQCQVGTLGTALISATGGAGGSGTVQSGGDGSVGRIHIDYYTSYTGTTSPTIDATQDNTLVTNTTYQLRFGVSSDGTTPEHLAKAADLTIATNTHVAVAWDASAASAEFFVNGASIGTSVGTLTAIEDNTSRFTVGCDLNTNGQHFFDGKMDELRVWNLLRTASQLYNNKENEIAVNTSGLVAYYQFDNNADDSTSNANNLTATNSPTYATDVPFASPTTRLDLDQSLDTSGDTYALTTAISETAANRQTFVPNKDPQKSIEVNISDTGDDSDWTLTVHDVLNRTVASATVTHANLHTGDFEFIFSSVWRPVRGASYHFHLTATTTTGTPLVVSTSSNDLETADFHTYYQFLVEDVYHPIAQIVNQIVIGNERYVATYDATTYNPHRLVLPSGWRVRCIGKWQGYVAFGCMRETNVYDHDKGLIVLWDGYSKTYNDVIEVPEGAINALFGTQGTLYIVAGYQGDLLEYTGGSKANKVRRFPKMTRSKYMEVLPNALNMWQALLRIGAATSDSTDVERGVYTYGHVNEGDPDALTYDYPLSTGTLASTGVQIGVVIPVDKKLLIGWKDGTAYGVDVVNPAGSPFATGTIERDIKDYGGVWKEKQAQVVRADFKPLASGDTIKLKYKLDRNSAWTEGATISTTGETVARLPINFGNHKEAQIAADFGLGVTMLELTLEENLKLSEQIV